MADVYRDAVVGVLLLMEPDMARSFGDMRDRDEHTVAGRLQAQGVCGTAAGVTGRLCRTDYLSPIACSG